MENKTQTFVDKRDSGKAEPSGAVVLHEGSTIVVVLNALRLIAWLERANSLSTKRQSINPLRLLEVGGP